MADAGLVRRNERVSDLNGDRQRLLNRERTVLQPMLQRLPLQVLHDEVADRLP